jgi:hypothetical protein
MEARERIQPEPGPAAVTVPRWRVAAGIAVLAAMVGIAARFVPVYVRNWEFQQAVAEIAQRVETPAVPEPVVRLRVCQVAQDLGLPVKEADVQVRRAGDSIRLEVRYDVRVDLALYTVNLPFYPRAASR